MDLMLHVVVFGVSFRDTLSPLTFSCPRASKDIDPTSEALF
jgi:hypothetical protein